MYARIRNPSISKYKTEQIRISPHSIRAANSHRSHTYHMATLKKHHTYMNPSEWKMSKELLVLEYCHSCFNDRYKKTIIKEETNRENEQKKKQDKKNKENT